MKAGQGEPAVCLTTTFHDYSVKPLLSEDKITYRERIPNRQYPERGKGNLQTHFLQKSEVFKNKFFILNLLINSKPALE